MWLTGVHLGAGCQRRNRAGIWKITCIAILKLSFQHNPAPLIEVDAQARILWRNDQAEAGLSEHLALKASGTRLRARNRAFDKGLRDAIVATSRIVLTQIPNRQADEAVCAVLLGEDGYGTPQYCWVFADDGRILVSFDDGAQLDQRLAVAARIAEEDPRMTARVILLSRS